MKKKNLRQTNPHLKDPKKIDQRLIRTVLSSSRIEGIDMSAKALEALCGKPDVIPPAEKTSHQEHH
jgi:hypothetical protein